MIVSGLLEIGKLIIGGVKDHYEGKRKIKQAKVEADVKVIQAEATSKIKMAEQGQIINYNLDLIAMKNMEKSWKDELILVIFLTPLVMSFIPWLQQYVFAGFEALDKTPEWYRYIVIGMIVVIYGMRGMLDKFLKLLIDRWSK